MAAAVYAPAVGCGFVAYDDGDYVFANPHVLAGLTVESVVWALTYFHAGFWLPTTWLSLQLDTTLFGPGPAGYHATNVVLHATNGALLYLVLRSLTGSDGRSAAVALLWAVHPLRVESVAWVTERKDVLSGLFSLLAVWAYVRAVQAVSSPLMKENGGDSLSGEGSGSLPGATPTPHPQSLSRKGRGGRKRTRLWLVAVFFALGLGAKPMLVTLPFALLLLDFWPLNRLRSVGDLPRLAWEKGGLFALSAVLCVATMFAQTDAVGADPAPTPSLAERMPNAAVAYPAYLKLTAWPADLRVLYLLPREPLPVWQPILSAGLILTATAVAWGLRRRAPYLLVGWLWFLGTLVPVVGIVQSGEQHYADRFTYLPHVGLFVAGVWAAADLAGRLRVPGGWQTAAVLVVAAAWAFLAVRQLDHWRDTRAMWEHVLAVDPTNPTAWAGLGGDHFRRRDWAAAARCLDEACRLDPANEKYVRFRATARDNLRAATPP